MSESTETNSVQPPAEDPNLQVQIRILVHETKIGCLVCAKGHEQRVPIATARALEALGKAEIIGV